MLCQEYPETKKRGKRGVCVCFSLFDDLIQDKFVWAHSSICLTRLTDSNMLQVQSTQRMDSAYEFLQDVLLVDIHHTFCRFNTDTVTPKMEIMIQSAMDQPPS